MGVYYSPDDKVVPKGRHKSHARLVVDGFVYHSSVVRQKPPIRYLVCAYSKRYGCYARANLPLYADKKCIQITRSHNHPPDHLAEERDLFLAQLKDAVRSLPGSLKNTYASVALIYPNVASNLPFKQLQSSMTRWRQKANLQI